MQETLTDDTIVSEKLLPLSWMERCEGGKDDTSISVDTAMPESPLDTDWFQSDPVPGPGSYSCGIEEPRKSASKPKKAYRDSGMLAPGIPDDGLEWLKYGKKVRKFKYGKKKEVGSDEVWRHYYQCKRAGCKARRILDENVTNSSESIVMYVGENHICGQVLSSEENRDK